MERIAATTTEDPFVAILATATPPATEETATLRVERYFFDKILILTATLTSVA